MRFFNAILFMLFCFLSGCIQKELTPAQYMTWVKSEEHGLRIGKQIGNCSFTLQYKPCEYEALLHHKNEIKNELDLNKLTAPLKNLQYFTLTIKNADGKEIMEEGSFEMVEYGSKLNYMISDMQMDFSLIDGNDTVSCAFYHYERNFGVSPENNILLGFEIPATDKNRANDKTLIYEDKLLGNGIVMLTIKSEDIKQVPRLKFAK
ncbi:hypothetical protein BH11BAC7_BH11BAC7_32950 [soil metagenome]